MKKLYRSKANRVIAGVAGGIAEYLDVDPVLIRFLFIILTVFGGAGFLIYLLAIVVIPEEGQHSVTVDEMAEKMGAAASRVADSVRGTVKDTEWSNRVEYVVGLFILLLGFVFFIQLIAGIFSLFHLWPLILILLGLLIIVKR